jgi:hypothetical protein
LFKSNLPDFSGNRYFYFYLLLFIPNSSGKEPFFILILLTGCDPVYPPFVESGFECRVDVIVEYKSGKKNEGFFDPGSSVWEGSKAKKISKISIYQEGKFLFSIDKKDMDELRSLLKKGDKEITWYIDANGIKLYSHDKKLIGEIKK